MTLSIGKGLCHDQQRHGKPRSPATAKVLQKKRIHESFEKKFAKYVLNGSFLNLFKWKADVSYFKPKIINFNFIHKTYRK